jgi:hypothetical protein
MKGTKEKANNFYLRVSIGTSKPGSLVGHNAASTSFRRSI